MNGPGIQHGRGFWLASLLKALFCLWLLSLIIAFSWFMHADGRIHSWRIITFLKQSGAVAGLLVSYALLVAATARLAHRRVVNNALERLSVKPGVLRLVVRCWWRAGHRGPLRHGLLALRGERLYGYRFFAERAEETSLPLADLRAAACLPPQSIGQWLLGCAVLRLIWEDGRHSDVMVRSGPRVLPVLEDALLAARAAQ